MSFVETPEPYIAAVTTFLRGARRLMWRHPPPLRAGRLEAVRDRRGDRRPRRRRGRCRDRTPGRRRRVLDADHDRGQERTNVYYLRAVAPETHVQGCSMRIRFIWKPDYHAIQYLGANAIITVSGTDIAGSYRQKFTRKGLALDVGPVDLRGGYKVWSAKVTAMDGDPPGNDTTVQTAPPTNSNCT